MSGEDFTFAGVEQVLTNGLTTIISAASVVGMVLIIILLIALGWNYFKLLLETVESPMESNLSETGHFFYGKWCSQRKGVPSPGPERWVGSAP